MKAQFVVCVLLLAATGLRAQDRSPRDLLDGILVPPVLLMENQAALGLTDVQTKFIKDEIQKGGAKFTDLEWNLKKESEALAMILHQNPVDEKSALAQLEKVLQFEGEIKKSRLTMIVRIKNQLTPDQQETLRKLRAEQWERDMKKNRGDDDK
jgi:Spy/CpxP family protein refolding chaperone